MSCEILPDVWDTQLRYYFRLRRVNYLLMSESLTTEDTRVGLSIKI